MRRALVGHSAQNIHHLKVSFFFQRQHIRTVRVSVSVLDTVNCKSPALTNSVNSWALGESSGGVMLTILSLEVVTKARGSYGRNPRCQRLEYHWKPLVSSQNYQSQCSVGRSQGIDPGHFPARRKYPSNFGRSDPYLWDGLLFVTCVILLPASRTELQ